jgi:hypothetical protein
VAARSQPAYFTDARDGGKRFRVYTAAMPDISGGALVRASHAASADSGAALPCCWPGSPSSPPPSPTVWHD